MVQNYQMLQWWLRSELSAKKRTLSACSERYQKSHLSLTRLSLQDVLRLIEWQADSSFGIIVLLCIVIREHDIVRLTKISVCATWCQNFKWLWHDKMSLVSYFLAQRISVPIVPTWHMSLVVLHDIAAQQYRRPQVLDWELKTVLNHISENPLVVLCYSPWFAISLNVAHSRATEKKSYWNFLVLLERKK
jgi:hypothetical protein